MHLVLYILLLANILSILSLFGYSLWVLIREGRILIIANVTQLVLFCLLYFLIFVIFGKDNYQFIKDPTWLDWIQFTMVHVLRAADFVDFIEEYHINIQNIKHANAKIATVIMIMHWIVDIFLLSLIWETIRKIQYKQAQQKKSKTKLQVFFTDMAFIFIILGMLGDVSIQAWTENRSFIWVLWNLLFAWPFDNILRLIDIGDALQLYGIRLHEINVTNWTATLSIAFRFLLSFPVAKLIDEHLPKPTATTHELIDALGDSSKYQHAADLLEQRGLYVVPELILALEHPNPEIRENVINILFHIEPDEIYLKQLAHDQPYIINVLVKSLADPIWYIQKTAAEMLGLLGKPAQAAIGALLIVLADAEFEVREAAKTALNKISPKWPYHPLTRTTIFMLAKQVNSNLNNHGTTIDEILANVETDNIKALSRLTNAPLFAQLFSETQTINLALAKILADSNNAIGQKAIITACRRNACEDAKLLVFILTQALHSAAEQILNKQKSKRLQRLPEEDEVEVPSLLERWFRIFTIDMWNFFDLQRLDVIDKLARGSLIVFLFVSYIYIIRYLRH